MSNDKPIPSWSLRWPFYGLVGIIHVALWTLFISKCDLRETWIGLIASTAAVGGAVAYGRTGLVQFRPAWRDLLQCWRMPQYLFTGTWEILCGLGLQLSQPGGAPSWVLAVPFDIGGDDSQSAARRALAVAYTTATPNFVVMGTWPDPSERDDPEPGGAGPKPHPFHRGKPVGPERGLLLYHQIKRGEVLEMVKKLGAKP
jgi:hypothetical protein